MNFPNFHLTQIPYRTDKPRKEGLTVISDKGLSVAEATNLLSVASPYIDFVKLAFGTALLTPDLPQKLKLYRDHGLTVYFGGLLFEAYVIRNQLKDFVQLLDKYEITAVEISDGEIGVTHEQKCAFIRQFSSSRMVVSEIGSSDKDKVQVTPPYKWIKMINAELEAGSNYIVAEAKETGTDGIYRNSGEIREGLVDEIATRIPADKMIWEAPAKDQQLHLIKRFGANANLANVNPEEVIALEAMRVGLRGDTFSLFLDKSDWLD